MAPRPARINHRYEVLARLGEGVLGEVYRVRDTVERREVALKLIREEAFARDQLRYLKHEFRLLSEWRHPHVASVLDFERLAGSGRCFFTLEHMPGRDFRTACKGLALAEQVPLFVQLCRALAFVHSRELIHYDLKPRNVMVVDTARGPVVRLFDFHLAREGPKVTSAGLEGTIGYMPPEVIAEGEVDRRADLYSLGAMMYEILGGRLPFSAKSSAEVARRQIADPPRPLRSLRPQVDARMARLVHALLEKDPDRRPGSAGEVIQELNRIAGREFTAETARTREGYVLSTRCVGREAELAALKRSLECWVFEGWSEAAPGTKLPARAVLLAGPPGSGRTRLLRELRVRCQARGILWLSAACRRHDPMPGAPFVRILEAIECAERDLLVARGGPRIAAAHAPAALDRLRGAGDGLLRDRDARLRASEGIAEAVLGLSLAQPCVLAVEDLHQADPATLEMWEHLTRVLGSADRRLRAADAPGQPSAPLLLMCGTVQAGEAGDARSARLLGAPEDDGADAEVVRLVPMTEEDVAAHLRGMADWERLPSALVRRVTAESRGLPLYVEELMKFLLDEGIVREAKGRWSADERALGRLELPRDALVLFSREVGRLPADQARVMELLALFEDPAPRAVAAALARLPAARFAAACEDLAAAKLVVEGGHEADRTLRLAHLPYKRTLYRRLGRARRREEHRRIAAALEKAFGADDPVCAGELAHHLRLAGPARADKAARVSEVAAAQAERNLDFLDALEHLQYVRERLAKGSVRHGRLADICERMGGLYHQTGTYARALASYRLARVHARAEYGDEGRAAQRVAARLETCIGRALEARGDFSGALRCYERAAAIFGPRSTAPEAARVLLQIARVRGYRFSRYRSGIEHARRALAVLQKRGAVDDVVAARRCISTISIEHGRLADALEQEHAILSTLEDGGNASSLAATHNGIGLIHLVRSDFAASRAELEQALDLAGEIEIPGMHAMILNNLGFAHEGLGLYRRARELWEHALEIGERTGDRRRIAEQKKNLGALAHRLGDSTGGLALLESSRRSFEAIRLPTETREACLELAKLHADLGLLDAAEKILRDGAATGSQSRSVEAHCVLTEGRLRLARRDWPGAEERLRAAEELYGAFECTAGRIDAGVALAHAALGRGEPAEAMVSLTAAEERLRSADHPPQRAEVRLLRGEVHLAQGAAFSLQAALQPLRESLELAESLRSPWLLWRVLWAISRHAASTGKKNAAVEYAKDAAKVLEEACAGAPAEMRGAFYHIHERAELRKAALAT